jgi:hypothetical protein
MQASSLEKEAKTLLTFVNKLASKPVYPRSSLVFTNESSLSLDLFKA